MTWWRACGGRKMEKSRVESPLKPGSSRGITKLPSCVLVDKGVRRKSGMCQVGVTRVVQLCSFVSMFGCRDLDWAPGGAACLCLVEVPAPGPCHPCQTAAKRRPACLADAGAGGPSEWGSRQPANRCTDIKTRRLPTHQACQAPCTIVLINAPGTHHTHPPAEHWTPAGASPPANHLCPIRPAAIPRAHSFPNKPPKPPSWVPRAGNLYLPAICHLRSAVPLLSSPSPTSPIPPPPGCQSVCAAP